MTSKNILNINHYEYKSILNKVLKHDCYVNSINSLRQAKENFLEIEEIEPTLSEFTHGVETLNISLPFPITQACVVKDPIDHCKRLLEEKQQYYSKLESFLTRYKKDKRWLTKKYVKGTKYGMLPKYVYDMAVGKLKDPDTYFNDDYNCYYTGGTLDTCQILNEKYLVYVNNANLLCLTNQTGQNHTIELENLDKAPIFNIRTTADKGVVVTIRQKNKICGLELISINDDFTFNLLTTQRSTEVPYIDFKYYDNEIATLKLNRLLQIQPVDNKVYDERTFEATTTPDSFGQIEYMDSNNIIAVDRRWMRIYDKRSKQEQMCVIKDDWLKCDKLCTFTLSKNTNYVFVASAHNIFKFDLRKLSVVKKWSHMLSVAPSMIKMENYDQNELIFLSSQSHEDRIILLSNENESNLVQMVPNNSETLTKCNKTYNFNFYSDYMERLSHSTTGISILQGPEGMELYTCNSIGDIFKNNVSQEDNVSRVPLDKLDTWLNAFPKKQTQLIVSDIRELSYMKDVLEQTVNTKALNKYTMENKKRLDLLSDMTVEDVDMAAIWLSEERPREDLLPSTSSINKVSQWLLQREEQSSDDTDDEKTEVQSVH